MAEPDADRLREQYEQAERLVREAQAAAEAAAAASSVPPRGWATPGEDRPPPPPFDVAQITALVEALRGVVPPDLSRQLAEALRQLLLALRAVLDWYIARLDGGEPPSRDVQDIPVE
jgi:hypothetical protein